MLWTYSDIIAEGDIALQTPLDATGATMCYDIPKYYDHDMLRVTAADTAVDSEKKWGQKRFSGLIFSPVYEIRAFIKNAS